MWSARRRLATRLIGARGLYALLLYRDFLWLTGGICSASRYFAIVRRATTMPCSPRICEMRASESGALASSAATSCLISARIAVEDAAPPASVATWLPKKYLSSKVPRGVAMYFCVVTREMVLSWSPSVCAISRSTSGRIATSPCSRKWRCWSTIACDTRRMVSKRCCTFLISQRASCSCEAMAAPLVRAPAASSAYRRLMRRRGMASGLRLARQAPRRLIGHDAQLQRQALPGGARAHAGGLQVLQVPERDAQLLGIGFGGQQRGDFLERLGQIAVLVEGVDQQLDEYAVAIAEIGERELAAQVIAQRRRVRRGEAAVALVVVVRPAPAGGDIRRPVGVGGRGLGAAARASAARRRRRGCGGLGLAFGILALERRVVHQHAVDLLVELDRRQLQQADRLLQLRS